MPFYLFTRSNFVSGFAYGFGFFCLMRALAAALPLNIFSLSPDEFNAILLGCLFCFPLAYITSGFSGKAVFLRSFQSVAAERFLSRLSAGYLSYRVRCVSIDNQNFNQDTVMERGKEEPSALMGTTIGGLAVSILSEASVLAILLVWILILFLASTAYYLLFRSILYSPRIIKTEKDRKVFLNELLTPSWKLWATYIPHAPILRKNITTTDTIWFDVIKDAIKHSAFVACDITRVEKSQSLQKEVRYIFNEYISRGCRSIIFVCDIDDFKASSDWIGSNISRGIRIFTYGDEERDKKISSVFFSIAFDHNPYYKLSSKRS